MFDLIIIGGGPAGAAAGVYASRKKIKTLLITESFGGQSIVSEGIQNWVGDIEISGLELAKKLEEHVKAYAKDTLEIAKGQRVEKIEQKPDKTFTIKTKEKEYQSRAVLITTGSGRKKLTALNADKFEHRGLTYCASCDGPMFSDKDVVVVGGGNSAIESAAQLLAYCKSVTLIHRRDTFRAEAMNFEHIKQNPKLKIITNAEILEILGDKMVSGLKYKNKETDEIVELKVDGIFVEIGAIPATNFVEGLIELDETKQIKIDPWNQRTSLDGIWAAGDATNILYHQNNIAAGDAVKALEDIYIWLM